MTTPTAPPDPTAAPTPDPPEKPTQPHPTAASGNTPTSTTPALPGRSEKPATTAQPNPTAALPDPPEKRAATAQPDPFAALPDPLERLAVAVGNAIPAQGRLGVAFSAGVDSTVLLALAVRARGTAEVVAITGDSPSLARRELGEARALAGVIGVPLIEVQTAEGELPEYRRNGLDRCFHCKDTLFRTIDDTLLDEHGLTAVAYGETADDVERDDRPGAVAATRHGVLRPLAVAGLRKADIRAIAAALGLPNFGKPAAPCLASRIPHGEEVTPEKLRQIEAAEGALHDLGLPDLRVRHHGSLARLEVPLDRLADVAADPLRGKVLAAVRAAGFTMVTLDLGGLRSGELFQIARQR